MRTSTTTLLACLGLALGPAGARELTFQSELSHPLLPAGEKTISYLKVGVTGGERPDADERAPINVSIVLDRSGSMSGAKIERAREAAKMAVGRLRADDTVSIVTYDDVVQVLVPSTKLTQTSAVYEAIDGIRPGGSTALFAGVSKGAEELRKFKRPDVVNRLILLSDGLANVGPQSPRELGELGASLAGERISVTTIGLGTGYNEDLMNQLALNSDGTHSFVETPGELAQVFDQELGDLLSVVAQNLSIEVELAEGIRPVRSLGRDAEISGQSVRVSFNQLFAKQEKFLLLEVESPALADGRDQAIATATLRYRGLDGEQRRLDGTRSVARVSADAARVEQSMNREVMVAAVDFIANERNRTAVQLRDAGKVEEARDLLYGNSRYLQEQAEVLESEKLALEAAYNSDDARKVESDDWGVKRKAMSQRWNSKVSQNDGYRSQD